MMPGARGSSARVAGLLMLGLLLAQQLAGWRWPGLDRLQTGDAYMQLSGFVLLALVAHQWYFSFLRASGQVARAAAMAEPHKLAGACAPLPLYLHSQVIGHGYLAVLSVVFLAVLATGLLNLAPAGRSRAAPRGIRVLLHVALSTGLLFLLGYHVYISYLYE